MTDRRRAAFGLLIAAQAAHSVEEYVTRMYDVFAPAEFVSRLFSSNLKLGFAIFNGVLVLFGIWCYVARVRTAHANERAVRVVLDGPGSRQRRGPSAPVARDSRLLSGRSDGARASRARVLSWSRAHGAQGESA